MDTVTKESEGCPDHPQGNRDITKAAVFKMESEMVQTGMYTIFLLFMIELVAYFGFFQNIPDFFSKFGYYILFLGLVIVMNAVAVWHVKAYQHTFSMMTGMMIGMTLGMSTGFGVGLIVGATNGMFIGSLAGLVLGMGVGSYVGKCCGIMGLMEGMMAGLMGGPMGAMTSVMALNDNLKLFIPILVLSLLGVLLGLVYMIYMEEVRQREVVHYKGFALLPFMTVNFIITLILTFVMVYGPRSFLFA